MIRLWAVVAMLLVDLVYADDLSIPAPPKVEAKSYYLVDFASGEVLAESHARERLEPASLTKLMTAYVVFDALANHRIDLADEVAISEKAWRMTGSRMFIEVNTTVTVEELVQGMIIQSGNDASVALAEHLAGSESAFVELMNETAQALGMEDTSFHNPTGLPAEGHYSTAFDLALLARAVIKQYPEYYDLYARREFTYNDITQHNRNSLLWRDGSVDGMKTGYTRAAGYCLVSSAERAGMRLIAVVMGMPSAASRTAGSQALLNYGFEFFETHQLYARGEPITEARVWKGEPRTVALGLGDDFYVTVPRGQYETLRATVNLETELVAPIGEQESVGRVKVALPNNDGIVAPLISLHGVREASFWGRMTNGVRELFE